MYRNYVEIKFIIVPEGFSHIRRFGTGLTLLEMKQAVEEDLRIPVSSMKLMYSGHEMVQPLLSDYNFSAEQTNTVRARAAPPSPPPAPPPPSSPRLASPRPGPRPARRGLSTYPGPN